MRNLNSAFYLALIGSVASALVNSLLVYLMAGTALWLSNNISRMIGLLLPSMLLVGAVTGFVSASSVANKSGRAVAILSPFSWVVGLVAAGLVSEAVDIDGAAAYALIIVFGSLVGVSLVLLEGMLNQ